MSGVVPVTLPKDAATKRVPGENSPADGGNVEGEN